MGPPQQARALDGVGVRLMFDHGPIGQACDIGFMPGETLPMQLIVKFWNFPRSEECLGLDAATEETGPVADGECCYFIQKEKRSIALAHGLMMHVFVAQFAGNPVAAGPAALAQSLVRPVKFSAAISQHGSALGHGNDATVRLNAVLQGHGREPEW